MSFVDVANGEMILVQIGDGATPEVFAHDCLINTSRAINMTASTVTNTVPNCTDPSAPAKTMRTVSAVDTSISGSGKMHASSVKTWQDRLLAGAAFNVRTKVAGKWQVAAPYVLTSFQVNGEPHTNAEVSVTLEQADAPTVTDGA